MPARFLPRLAEIRRSVKNSVRSHYERKDIEREGMSRLMLKSAKVGQGYLLAHADLQAFLERVAEGNEPASLLAPRSQPSPRRRLRELVQVDHIPTTLDTAPGNVTFQPGQLARVCFDGAVRRRALSD